MTVTELINRKQEEFSAVLNHLKGDLSSIRTGRASTALVEMIPVEAYGSTQPIRDLAQITIPEPKQILIQPWDKSLIKDVEKAIQLSPLGVSAVNSGGSLRITLPPLTEDRRKELARVVKQHAEGARISVRNLRESIIKELRKLEDEGGISEDERFRGEENLQKRVEEINQKIKELAEAKESEVLTI